MNLTMALDGAKAFTKRNSATILAVAAAGGVVTTAVLAAKATPKYLEIREEIDIYRVDAEQTKKDQVIEDVTSFAKCYGPTLISAGLTITCILCSNKINLKKNAAILAAYQLSEKALSEYKSKVVETIGERKNHVIMENMAKDKVKANPPKEAEIIKTYTGDYVCYEWITGRYFYTNAEKIREAKNRLNEQLLNEGYATLNDFFGYLGLNAVYMGEELGWDKNNVNGAIDIHEVVMDAEEYKVDKVLMYETPPKYEGWR